LSISMGGDAVAVAADALHEFEIAPTALRMT
jgi:hypothetical protein